MELVMAGRRAFQPTEEPRKNVELTLRPARLLAPLRRIEPGLPGPRGLLLPGFRQFGHPPCRWVSLQHGLDSLCWRDLHPLELQLASLHQNRPPPTPAQT